MRKRETLQSLLKENKAHLIRQSNHYVYKLGNGKIFVTSKTSGDRNVEKVQIRLLRKLL